MIRLSEVVPVSATSNIERGLENKYKNLGEDTFGADIEFHTSDPDEDFDIDPHAHLDDFYAQAKNSQRAMKDYDSWLENKRDNMLRGNRWDDSYGPIDVVSWQALNPEPSTEDGEYSQWLSDKKDVEYAYGVWNNNDRLDHLEYWVRDTVYSGDWTDYFEVSTDTERPYDEEAEHNIANFIAKKTGKPFDETGWDVGQDGGDVVEVRTPPMKYNTDNLSLLEDVMDFCHRNYYATGNTSAHIHVGLPVDVNVFDLIAATTLVDEKAIQKDISMDRELEQFAALSPKLHRTIIAVIKKLLGQTGERKLEDFVGKSFTVENKTLLVRIKDGTSRMMGTNIISFFKHKTLEFRYFSSQIAPHFGKFEQWIKYFMLIPKIAAGRNQCLVGKGEQFPLVFTRINDDETRITILGRTGKMPKPLGMPSAQLRTKKSDSLKDLLKKKSSEKV